jgi:hypothetical protein
MSDTLRGLDALSADACPPAPPLARAAAATVQPLALRFVSLFNSFSQPQKPNFANVFSLSSLKVETEI